MKNAAEQNRLRLMDKVIDSFARHVKKTARMTDPALRHKRLDDIEAAMTEMLAVWHSDVTAAAEKIAAHDTRAYGFIEKAAAAVKVVPGCGDAAMRGFEYMGHAVHKNIGGGSLRRAFDRATRVYDAAAIAAETRVLRPVRDMRRQMIIDGFSK